MENIDARDLDVLIANFLLQVRKKDGDNDTRHSKSNPIELNFNRTHRKEKKSIEPNRTFDFRTRDLCKTDVENPLPDLRSSSYFSPECSARVFRKRRNSAEMASDALWIVSFKCIVKGYQECRFDVKDGEVFRVCSVLFS